MTYRDVLLPISVNLQWQSAASSSTTLVRTDNGKEKRNANWTGTLQRGTLRYDARQRAVWEQIDQLFQIVQGMAYSFKVRDPRKHVATAAEGKFVAGQAVLRITTGAYTIDKPITKLDPAIALSGGTVDFLTGLVLTGSPTAWAGEFYLCCRFDVDALELTGVDREANGNYIAAFKDVPIVEVLGE